jgi:hypothetical protein
MIIRFKTSDGFQAGFDPSEVVYFSECAYGATTEATHMLVYLRSGRDFAIFLKDNPNIFENLLSSINKE